MKKALLFAIAILFIPVVSQAAITPLIKSGFTNTGMIPFTKTLSAASSTGADGLTTSIVRQEWDWQDDNSANGYPRFTHGNMGVHRYDTAGTSTVSLTVYDNLGNSSTTYLQLVRRAVPGNALTYYVDSTGGGSDAANGLTPATAWATLSKATSTLYASPPPGGSQILLKRGGTYDTQGEWDLHQRSAATGFADWGWMMAPPYYITIGAYGSGNRPIIRSVTGNPGAGDFATMLAFVDASGTVNNRGIILDSLDIQGSVLVKTHLTNDGNGNNYPDLPGLQMILRNSKVSNGNYLAYGGTPINENDEFDGTGLSSASIPYAFDNDPAFMLLASSTVHDSGNHCVYLSGASHSALLWNNTIYNCGSASHTFDGISAHGTQYDLNIIGNDIHDTYYCFGLDANTSPLKEWLLDVIVDRNKCHSTWSHVFQIRSIKNLTITNNLVYDTFGHDQPVFWFEADGGVWPTSNVKIYNNTLLASSTGVMSIDATSSPGTFGNADISYFNNIASTSPITFDNWATDKRAYSAATSTYLTMNNNLYFGGPSSGTRFRTNGHDYTQAAWLAANEPNSVTGSPAFNNFSTKDFSLATLSAAIAAGANKLVPYDYSQTLRSATVPAIGAYELLDSTVPAVTLTAPTNGAVASTSAAVLISTATDNIAIGGVKFYYGTNLIGSEVTTTSGPNTYSTTWNTNPVANGAYTLYAVARDTSNNYATSTGVSVTVSNALTATLSAPANGATVSGTAVSLSSTGTATAGLSTLQFAIDGVNFGAAGVASPYSLTWDSTAATDGTHTITVTVKDILGIYATSSVATVTVNNHPTVASGGSSGSSGASGFIPGYGPSGKITKVSVKTAKIISLSSSTSITRSLSYGARHTQVKLLQHFLNTHGVPVAKKGVGSLGHETNYFGLSTKAAVIKFQKKYGIKPANGLVGPLTRKKIDSLSD